MFTVMPTFMGTPVLTPEKIDTIKEWLRSALADSDKAEGEDAAYYEGSADAFESVLRLLHDNGIDVLVGEEKS